MVKTDGFLDGSGAIAVLAVVFQLSEDGSTTELLTAVTENLDQIVTPGTVTETGALDFAPLVEHLETTPLFQYTGSLTTPPCAEGLTFLVTQQPLPVNVAIFNAMKKVIKFNARYTQNALGEQNLLEVGAVTLGCQVENVAGGGDVITPPPAVNETVAETAPSETETAPAETAPAESVTPPAEHEVPTTTACTQATEDSKGGESAPPVAEGTTTPAAVEQPTEGVEESIAYPSPSPKKKASP